MNSTLLDKRRAGLLLPVYALRRSGDFGVGDTAAVREAIDFTAGLGMSVLQVLPIHETFGDHSPYNPISSHALSPAFISLDVGEVPGLTPEILQETAPESWLEKLRSGNVSHEAIHPLKTQILLLAFYRFGSESPGPLHEEFESFKQVQAFWLDSYTLYRLLIREYEGNMVWDDWRPEHRNYETALSWLHRHPRRESFEILRSGLAFIQWVAWRQWKAVRTHADGKGVRLMGEVSFGVGVNSADVWANPSLFDLEWSMGTRPLTHFDTSKDAERWGQNWGLPPYRWENHRSTGFTWLRGRITWEREFFHGCRLDHLRGYFRAYMFPWAGGPKHVEFSNLTEKEAALKTGGRLPRFVPGPDDDPVSARMNELQGRELIGQIIAAAGDMDLVAEIMGEMPDYMARTLEDLELANLSFPQLLRAKDRSILPPEAFREFSLATYANHDNAPLASLYLNLRKSAADDPGGTASRDLNALIEFADFESPLPEALDDTLLFALEKALFSTRSRLAVLMGSDLLGLPLRFNLPGSYGRGTWSDRFELPLRELAMHALYGKRIAMAAELAKHSGRS